MKGVDVVQSKNEGAPFIITPHKGYLNTIFKIRVLSSEAMSFYIDGEPIDVFTQISLIAGEHIIKCICNGKSYFDRVYVEDAIRLGGSNVVSGYCFDNSPWGAVVMKDRTYFFNTATKEHYVENGVSPLDVQLIKDNFFLLSMGERDLISNKSLVKDFSLYDVSEGRTLFCFQNLVVCDKEKIICEKQLEDGKKRLLIHNINKFLINSSGRTIDCVQYVIRDNFLHYCVIEDSGYRIYKCSFDTEESLEVYYSPNTFVCLTSLCNIIERCENTYKLIYTSFSNNGMLELETLEDECVISINGIKTSNQDPVRVFNTALISNKDTFRDLKLRLHTVLLEVCSDDEYLKKKHFYYNATKPDRPETTCEIIDLRTGKRMDGLAIDAERVSNRSLELIKSEKNIHMVNRVSIYRTITEAELVEVKGGEFFYKKNDKGKVTLTRLQKGTCLPEIESDFDIDVSLAKKFGVVVEKSTPKNIYIYRAGGWVLFNLAHLIRVKGENCFLTNIDADGQDWFLSEEGAPIMLPVGANDILSITFNCNTILSKSKRGVVLYEKADKHSDYCVDDFLSAVIDVDEYRFALFSDNGSHIALHKNNSWIYRNVETGEEVSFDIDNNVESKIRSGINGQNFFIRVNDLHRRPDLVDPFTLNIIRPGFLDKYSFVSQSGALTADTCYTQRRCFHLYRYYRFNTSVVYKNIDALLPENYHERMKQFTSFEGEKNKEVQLHFEKEVICVILDKLGIVPKEGEKYYIKEKEHSIITINYVGRKDGQIEIDLTESLYFLNSVVFSKDDKYVAICGNCRREDGVGWLNGFVGVYNIEAKEWKYGPNTSVKKAVWRSFFGANDIFTYYDSDPTTYYGVLEDEAFEEIKGRNVLAVSRTGKYFAMSDKGYISYTSNHSIWGHLKSTNIFVRNIDNSTQELSYSDHGADISGIFSSGVKNVICAAFSPDEKKLFSISDDGVIIIRNLHLQELQKDCSTIDNNILQAYAEAFEKTDASILEPFLKEDFYYSSVDVFAEIASKQEYLDYLSGKFETIRRTRAFVTVYVIHDRPDLLLLMQDGNELGVLNVVIENGLIARADMTHPGFCNIDISKYIPLPDLDIVPDCIDIARKVLSLVESKHYDEIYIPLNGISLPEGCSLNIEKCRPDEECFVDDDMFIYRFAKSEYMITKSISVFYVTTKDGKKDPDIYKYIEVTDTTLGAWQVYLLEMIWHFLPNVQCAINGKRSIVLDTRDLQNAIDTLNNKYPLHISVNVSEYNVQPRVVKRDNDYLVYCCYWPHFWSELIDATGPETQGLHWGEGEDTYMAEWKGPVCEVVRIVIENNKVKEVYDLSRKELFKIPPIP